MKPLGDFFNENLSHNSEFICCENRLHNKSEVKTNFKIKGKTKHSYLASHSVLVRELPSASVPVIVMRTLRKHRL